MSQPFCWLPTATFLRYLHANINQFTTDFEYVRTLSTADHVTWEHSKMMIMFLRLLKFSYESHQLSREIALWWDQKHSRRQKKLLYGLGFSATLQQFDYCWFLSKINWNRFAFKQDLQKQCLFGNVHMNEKYQARWQAVCESKDDFVKIEIIADLLQKYWKYSGV